MEGYYCLIFLSILRLFPQRPANGHGILGVSVVRVVDMRLQITGYNMLTNRPPVGMPNGMWTRVGWYRMLGALAVGGLVVLLFFHLLGGLELVGIATLPAGVSEFSGRWVIALAIPLFVILGILPRLAKKRFGRYLQRCDYLVCTECGYNLRGLPTEHKCPECGVRFDLAEIRRTWEVIFPVNI